jgi:RNA polymerase sigma-70 factor (ECF subfamily)
VHDADIEDAALVTRAVMGDPAAFALLLHRYSNRVFGMSLRMLDDHAESEDVTQEVFVTAWRRMSELNDPAAVRTWIFRIAHRECLGALRKRKGRRTYPTGELPDSGVAPVGTATPNGSSDPQRMAEADAGVDALCRALRLLTPPQRTVWLLAEVDGLSYAEIAEVVGATEQSVRGRLSRARGTLADAMREWR